MSVTLIIPTLRRYDLLDRCVQSACAGDLPPTHVMVIDNGVGMPAHTLDSLRRTTERAASTLQVVTASRNLGVAASWNLGLHQHDDWLIVSNDDVTFYETTIARLVDAAERNPDGLFFFPGSGGYRNAWSCFLQRKASLKIVGYYDEWVSPGYGFFEDNDYSYRLAQAGYRHIPVPNCAYSHVNSATVKSASPAQRDEHWERYRLAESRYVQMWGGTPGQERYTIAFDGAPPEGYQRSGYECTTERRPS